MKYELVLYTYTAATPEQQRQVNPFESVVRPEAPKSCEGVLWLNAAAWLFDLDRSRDIYDQILSEAKQRGVQLLCVELPDGFVYSLVPKPPTESAANLEEKILSF